MYWLILVSSLVFGLLLRLSFSTIASTDEWGSFWHVQRQKQSKWLNYHMTDSLLPGIRGYPILYHYLISRFPEKFWGIAGRILNSLFDILTAILIWATTLWVSNTMNLSGSIAGLKPELVAVLLFLTSPILLPVTARMKGIKARSLGLFLVTIFFGFLGIGINSNSFSFYLLTIVIGLLIILTSQFAVQVMIFFSLFLALYFLVWSPVVIILIVLLVGYLTPKLGTKEVLQFMWHHKVWYLRNYEQAIPVNNRNRLNDIILYPVYAITNPAKFIDLSFRYLTPVIAAYSVPIVFILFILRAREWQAWNIALSNPELRYLWAIILASLLVFGLISLRPLSFLGQAERYFEYSTSAASILVSVLLLNFPDSISSSLFWVILLFHLIVIYLNALFLNREDILQSKPNIQGNIQEVIDWCINNLVDAHIATVPIKLAHVLSISTGSIRNNRFKFYYRFTQRPGESGFQYLQDDTGGLARYGKSFAGSFEVFKISPFELSAKYGITHIFIERQFLDGLRQSWDSLEAKILDEPIFGNEAYIVCAIPKS